MTLVRVETPRPHVALVTLDNPARLNALSFGLVEALYAALARVGADNDAWVAVLTGAGRGFCAGLDLEDKAMPPGSQGLGLARLGMRAMAYMSGLVPAMRAIPQPIIAAVNGPATAAACVSRSAPTCGSPTSRRCSRGRGSPTA